MESFKLQNISGSTNNYLPIGLPFELELMASVDWNWGGPLSVPKWFCDGNTGPPGIGGATGGDLVKQGHYS